MSESLSAVIRSTESSDYELVFSLMLATEKKEERKTDDLFKVHDFDIKIDFDVPLLNSSALSMMPKGISSIKDTAPKRSLNLSEYKKLKGLI
ncbi:Rtf1 [Bugula neritina]|uniref:Rtf1 n=1 Tax=Bugula neritina TaxID=10212 RepID=A0A7J7JCL6_BUGNE|nr:Rtf1 [Bugula neritina]